MTVIAGARITGATRLAMAADVGRRYVAGEAIRAIAQDLGRSYGFVQQLLVESGVPPRTRGGDTRSPAARAQRAQAASNGPLPRTADRDTEKHTGDQQKARKKAAKQRPAKQKASHQKSDEQRPAKRKQDEPKPGKQKQDAKPAKQKQDKKRDKKKSAGKRAGKKAKGATADS